MAKTRQDLTVLIQVRVSPEGKAAIEKASEEEQTSTAEFCRRALYQASRFTRAKSAR